MTTTSRVLYIYAVVVVGGRRRRGGKSILNSGHFHFFSVLD
jgi:ribosomal protein S16